MQIKLTINKELVWSTRRFRQRAAAILFRSRLKTLRSSSSGEMLFALLGFLPPMLRREVVVDAVLEFGVDVENSTLEPPLAGVKGGVGRVLESELLWESEDCQMLFDLVLWRSMSEAEMYWLLPAKKNYYS